MKVRIIIGKKGMWCLRKSITSDVAIAAVPVAAIVLFTTKPCWSQSVRNSCKNSVLPIKHQNPDATEKSSHR